MIRADARTVGPRSVPIGLAPPHPTRLASSLAARFAEASKAIRAAAPELVGLTRVQAAARVRSILRARLSPAAISRAGAQLEAQTRARWEASMAQLLAAAVRRRVRGDRVRKPTVITLAAGKGLPRIVAPDAGETVDRWADRAAKLVRSVEEHAIEGIARDVARAVEAGETPAALARRWAVEGLPLKGGGRMESRLALIADNQVARLNGELGRARAKAVGIEQQRWITMGDSKVRPEHRAREGKAYDVAKGIGGVYPGDEPNCRCHAESVIDDDTLDRLLGLAR